jgi:hypothetical protein
MGSLLESWLPGLKIPRREDYLAGGRWARQSYYEALYSVATSIIEDAESYTALKLHLQRVRTTRETDPIPQPRETVVDNVGLDIVDSVVSDSGATSKLQEAMSIAHGLIGQADQAGKTALDVLFRDSQASVDCPECQTAAALYSDAFAACTRVLSLDKHAFHAPWFRCFYRRNYDALTILSIYDNVVANVDNVRYW